VSGRATSLDSSWDKLWRGESHLHNLKAEIESIVGPDLRQTIPLVPVVEESGMTVTVTWSVGQLPPIDQSGFGLLIVGDALTNFRAALDHLAWTIVRCRGADLGKLSHDQRRRISYPFAPNAGRLAASMREHLPGIRPRSPLGLIAGRYQPFRRSLVGKALRGLRDLMNRDKHRLLIPTFWYPGDSVYWFDAPGWSVLSHEALITNPTGGERGNARGSRQVHSGLDDDT
jgi:hypothetical protein